MCKYKPSNRQSVLSRPDINICLQSSDYKTITLNTGVTATESGVH